MRIGCSRAGKSRVSRLIQRECRGLQRREAGEGLSYYRLHGSPKVYYSAYSAEFIARVAARVKEEETADRAVWVIFDNTTLGAATRNALELSRALQV